MSKLDKQYVVKRLHADGALTDPTAPLTDKERDEVFRSPYTRYRTHKEVCSGYYSTLEQAERAIIDEAAPFEDFVILTVYSKSG